MHLYINSASAFIASLANVINMRVGLFNAGFQSVEFDTNEFADAADYFNSALKIDSGAQLVIYIPGKNLIIRKSLENGLYVRYAD